MDPLASPEISIHLMLKFIMQEGMDYRLVN